MQPRIRYGVDARPPAVVTLFGSLQWAGFVVASNAMVPLVLGDAYGLGAAQVEALTQRMFLIIGLVSLLQVLWGHRWPISEGVSYVWLGVFVTLAGVARASGQDPLLLLPKLQGGLIVAGLALVATALTGLAGSIRRLFTPTVVAVYLMLLPIQFSGPFLRAMLGVGVTSTHIDLRVTAVSLISVIATLGFSFLGRGWMRSISSLLGLVIGVIAWLVTGLPAGAGLSQSVAQAGAAVPAQGFLLAWGTPRWDVAVILTSVLTSFLLLSNVVAAIVATAQVTGETLLEPAFRRATMLNGAGGAIAGLFSGIGLVPVASSAGFIGVTGLASRLPFLFSCLLLIGASVWPPVARVVTLLPLPLAYAVTFAAFNEMFGLGVLRLREAPLTRGNLATLSLSVFIGTGLMFLPPGALSSLNPLLRNLLGNGLLTASLLSILLEHLVFTRLKAEV